MKTALSALLGKVLTRLGAPGIEPEVEIPVFATHGDYTTNIALTAAKTLKKSPMDIALQVQSVILDAKTANSLGGPGPTVPKPNQKMSLTKVDKDVLRAIEKIEIAPPGFINIFLSEAVLINQIKRVLDSRETFGKS